MKGIFQAENSFCPLPIPGGLSVDDQEHILQLQQSILEAVALGQEPRQVLEELCRLEERLVPQSVATVMLLDEDSGHLNVLAAPNVPVEGIARLNGLRPGPGAGSCGNAVYRQQPVFVANTLVDDRWRDIRQLAIDFGLCACWSMPVRGAGGKVVGTFALSSFEERAPDSFHRRLLEIGAFIVGIVLEQQRQQKALKRNEQRLMLAYTAFDNSTEGILITDRDGHIVEVNRGFSKMTGYTLDEVHGRTPAILRSGRQDRAFYADMWKRLDDQGRWSGQIWNRRKSGEIFPQWLSISAIRDDQGEIENYLAIFSDLSELYSSRQQMEYMSLHDSLTGIGNRTLLNERLSHAIASARQRGSKLALMLFDLDRFKNLNDAHGHAMGDEILQEVAIRLAAAVHEPDTIARLGGDEFVVLLESVEDTEVAWQMAEAFLALLSEPFDCRGQRFFLRASVGISIFPDDGASADLLLKHADAAMYHAKSGGGQRVAFYLPELTQKARQALAMENELQRAVMEEEFIVYYQPRLSAGKRRMVGVEALVRWLHPEQGLVPPGAFIPVAEELGLIVAIGEVVARRACAQLKAWLDEGRPPIFMSINLSERQLNREAVARVIQIVLDSGVPPGLVEFEITETRFMQRAEESKKLIDDIQAAGISIAIDDFGSGYSSLAYLKRFSVDILKIDQSLVQGIEEDAGSLAIVRAAIALGHAMDLVVVAEGVETERQAQLLEQDGCDQLQGFLFSRPVPAEAISFAKVAYVSSGGASTPPD